jgi:hypothetical protein
MPVVLDQPLRKILVLAGFTTSTSVDERAPRRSARVQAARD